MEDIVEYEYNNSAYYSEVNDFEDEYHEEDKEYSTDDPVMDRLLKKIRSHKRKYTNFAQWCQAKEEYIEYAERLIAKYGGKKRFKFLVAIGMVKDYIPLCPQLKKTTKNKMYVRSKNLIYVPKFDKISDLVESIIVPKKVLKKLNLNVDVVVTKGDIDVRGMIGDNDIKKNVDNSLMKIEAYYKGRTVKLTRRKKREQEAEIRKEIVAPKKDNGKSFKELMKKYEYNMNHGVYVEDIQEKVKRVKYRAVAITNEEAEEVEVYDALKALGLNIGNTIISKKSMKVIKKRDNGGKKPKKKKKGKRYKREKEFKKITDKEYVRYDDFSNDLRKLSNNILEIEGVL